MIIGTLLSFVHEKLLIWDPQRKPRMDAAAKAFINSFFKYLNLFLLPDYGNRIGRGRLGAQHDSFGKFIQPCG